jgi:16S rRNA (guanine(1405)-N(7))-methyltransferase
MTHSEDNDLDFLVRQIHNTRKYRNVEITSATIVDLLKKELPVHNNHRDALKVVRRKLHNIVATYLGDADVPLSKQRLTEAFQSGDQAQVKVVCSDILASHASTRERISILEDFYSRIFTLTGQPGTILDLACGLNPFTFPWMHLPDTVQYHAYDLNCGRIDLINHYFLLQGLAPNAQADDILVTPPKIQADIAFFFKEAHRFEQRQHGCNLPFWKALHVRYLLVSLPTNSLSGQHPLIEGHRRLVYNLLKNQSWDVQEILFANEIVFCIDKGYDPA